MKFKIYNRIKIIIIAIVFFVSEYSYAYSETQMEISGVLFPQQNVQVDTFNPFGGWSVKADVMNNVGFSFGLGHTWSRSYRWIDARQLYWFDERLYGFYAGIQEHLQYFNNIGFGAGLNIGYALPLTYYVTLNFNGEAGFSSSKFFRSIYNPFYFTTSLGLTFNI